MKEPRFRILALSGGGAMGAYTAGVLLSLEEAAGEALYTKFDLIAGTSIGGILALALAAEVPAPTILDRLVESLPSIFRSRMKERGWGLASRAFARPLRPLYGAEALRRTIEALIDPAMVMEDLSTRVIVPSINLDTGDPVVFKTPHHETLGRRGDLVVEAALATSAAPVFFPPHTTSTGTFVDGGLIANAPDLLALHEWRRFFRDDCAAVDMISIGTTTSKYTFPANRRGSAGIFGWLQDLSILKTAMTAGQQLAQYMASQELGDEGFLRIDHEPSPEQATRFELDAQDPDTIQEAVRLGRKSGADIAPHPVARRVLA